MTKKTKYEFPVLRWLCLLIEFIIKILIIRKIDTPIPSNSSCQVEKRLNMKNLYINTWKTAIKHKNTKVLDLILFNKLFNIINCK